MQGIGRRALGFWETAWFLSLWISNCFLKCRNDILSCFKLLYFPTCWSAFRCEAPIILHSGRRWITEDLVFLEFIALWTVPVHLLATHQPWASRAHRPLRVHTLLLGDPESPETQKEKGFFESLTTPTQHMLLARTRTHTLARLICIYRNHSVKEINSFNQISSFILIKQSSRQRNATCQSDGPPSGMKSLQLYVKPSDKSEWTLPSVCWRTSLNIWGWRPRWERCFKM